YGIEEKPEIRAIVRTDNAKPPATIPLQLRTPDGKVFDYVMHSAMLQSRDRKPVSGYSVQIEPNVDGMFRAISSVNLGGIKVEGEMHFIVTRPVTEFTGKPINRELLQQISAATNGKFYKLGEWDNWRKDLNVAEQHFSRVELTDLWNNPILIALVMALLTAEWITRKRWNLP